MADSRASNRKVLVLPGDGIGPEIMREVLRVVEFFDRRRIASFDISEDAVGGAAYEVYGTPLAEATLAKALASDAVLFGAVGGAKWDQLPFDLRPERGILRLRKEMDLFANLRPVRPLKALLDASTIKPEVLQGTDLLVVRELTGGLYFGKPSEIRHTPEGYDAIDTLIYTEAEIERIVRTAFELARNRRK